jgi:hypothetical protein
MGRSSPDSKRLAGRQTGPLPGAAFVSIEGPLVGCRQIDGQPAEPCAEGRQERQLRARRVAEVENGQRREEGVAALFEPAHATQITGNRRSGSADSF